MKPSAWIGLLVLVVLSMWGCSMSRDDEQSDVVQFSNYRSADELSAQLRARYQLAKRNVSTLISALKRGGAKCGDPKDVSKNWDKPGVMEMHCSYRDKSRGLVVNDWGVGINYDTEGNILGVGASLHFI
jgi:hypothetical protein